MFRKKNILIISSLTIGIIILIMAILSYRAQVESQKTYQSIKNGVPIRATVHKIPGQNYISGQKNKYLYTFTVNGKTYASATILKYDEEIIAENYNFIILYALDKNGGVKLAGENQYASINGQKYPLAVSYEKFYVDNSREPGIALSVFIFIIAGIILLFSLFNWIWVIYYKDIINNGILTYGIFIEASSKGGSRKYMSITFRYKDQNENWIETRTPYIYTTIEAEKLMQQDTFKVRYKNNKAVIVEDFRALISIKL